jgi:hypothetical protein
MHGLFVSALVIKFMMGKWIDLREREERERERERERVTRSGQMQLLQLFFFLCTLGIIVQENKITSTTTQREGGIT